MRPEVSHMIEDWLVFKIQFDGDKYVLLALSTFLTYIVACLFLIGMVREIKDNAIGMLTLVALAITVAFA